jgi:hypothetical protein
VKNPLPAAEQTTHEWFGKPQGTLRGGEAGDLR